MINITKKNQKKIKKIKNQANLKKIKKKINLDQNLEKRIKKKKEDMILVLQDQDLDHKKGILKQQLINLYHNKKNHSLCLMII